MPVDSRDKGRRVLIVDGDQAYAGALASKLVGQGYEVTIASPSEVFKLLGAFDPGVVLCDIEGAAVSGVNLPAQILTARPTLTCVAMAKRPNLRQTGPSVADGSPAFINKCQNLDVALDVVRDCFKRCETAAAADAGKDVSGPAALDEANRAKLEFLAKVSHELRTPLNAIIGFSELIMSDVLGPLGNEQYRSYIEDIHSSGRHLLDVINDILDFAKADSGQLLLQESDVDIQDVVTSISRLIGPRTRDAGITLHDVLPLGLSHLWCDKRKLKQMLINLLTNAVKFTPSGGRIDVTATEDAAGLTLIIRDTGIGIATTDLVRVLQPFVQADSTLNRRQEGTGLGLPLVKAMIEIHGGSISLQSEPDRGTTVLLNFPPERVIAQRNETGISPGFDTVRMARSAM